LARSCVSSARTLKNLALLTAVTKANTDNSLSSLCTVFDVFVAFRLAVLIVMHRYSSSNLKNYFGFGGTCPLCPMDTPLLEAKDIWQVYVLLSDIDSQFTAT